jgi:hypothetical protein
MLARYLVVASRKLIFQPPDEVHDLRYRPSHRVTKLQFNLKAAAQAHMELELTMTSNGEVPMRGNFKRKIENIHDWLDSKLAQK